MKRVCLLCLLVLILAGCSDGSWWTSDAFDSSTGGRLVPGPGRTPTPPLSPVQRKAEADGDMRATEQGRIDQQQSAQLTEQAQQAGMRATEFALEVAEQAPVGTAAAALAQVMVGQARVQATQIGEQATAVANNATEQAGFDRQQRLMLAGIEQDNARKAGERIASIWTVVLYAGVVMSVVVVVIVCFLAGDWLSQRKRMGDARVYKLQAEADQLNVQYTEQHTMVKDADGVWQVAGERPENQLPTAQKAQSGSIKSGPRIGRLTWFLMKAVKVGGRDSKSIPSRNVMGVSPEYWTAITDELVGGDWIPHKQSGKDTALWTGSTLGRLLDEVRNWENSPTPAEDEPRIAPGQVATG